MVSAKRMNAAIELRDAAMQLIKERGKEEMLQGVARTTVAIGETEMTAWTPAIDVIGLEIWAPNKVLNIWTDGGGEVEILSFRRGPWEAKLLALTGHGRGLKPLQ
jgi:hypothetical protein